MKILLIWFWAIILFMAGWVSCITYYYLNPISPILVLQVPGPPPDFSIGPDGKLEYNNWYWVQGCDKVYYVDQEK